MGEISFSFKDYSVERIGRVTDEWEKTQWFRHVLQKTDCLVLIQLLTRNFCRRSGSHSPKEHTGTEINKTIFAIQCMCHYTHT